MKRILLLLVIVGSLNIVTKAADLGPRLLKTQTVAPITDGFVTTWETVSANESILIPINPSYQENYNYNVNWGDGTSSTGQTGDATHTYADAGVYTVTITGAFPAIKFNSPASDDANDLRIRTVEKWGNGVWLGMDQAFMYCRNLTRVANDVGPVFDPNSTLYCMFYNCTSLNCDLNNWDMTNVREISEMFHGASVFNGNISGWDVSNVTNMQSLFESATAFNGDISGWNVSKVELMDNLFRYATAFNADISGWDVGQVQSMKNMFERATSFNQNIGSWDVSNVTMMMNMFASAYAFNQDLSGWNVSNVTNMSAMFQDASVFNGNISTWDVSRVTDMSSMFFSCEIFNQNLGSWNTAAVTTMSRMFGQAESFNQDIGAWDVHAVEDMANMFSYAKSFNQDISQWATDNLTKMEFMFARASSFNQDISNWNVAKVTSMEGAFYYAFSFNQNLGNWQVANVGSMRLMLDRTGLSAFNYESTLSGWASQSVSPNVILGADGLQFCSVSGRQSLINDDQWQIEGDRKVCLVTAVPDGQGIVYVDSAVAVPGDGSSWTNALKYTSDAIVSAGTNTQITSIHIAKGTYYPTGDKSLPYEDSTFIILRADLKILGGFANGGAERNVDLYPTVLSGDIGVADDTSDNSANIMVINGSPTQADSLVIEGLTFTQGRPATDGSVSGYGYAGGLTISNPTGNTAVRHCKFIRNYGIIGAALAVIGYEDGSGTPAAGELSGLQFQNCIFSDNHVIKMAEPGMLEFASPVVISGASAYFTNCDFIENTGALAGVAITTGRTGFNRCKFADNEGVGVGAIFNMQGGSSTLANSLLVNNTNGVFRLGLPGMEDPEALSNTVIGNFQSAHMSIINTTIANNSNESTGSATAPLIYNYLDAYAELTNSILWGNKTNTLLDVQTSTPSKISYSLIQGQPADNGRHILDGTSAVALFKDSANGNFELMPASPVINAGFNDSLILALAPYLAGTTDGGPDLAGNARIVEGTIDLGPYEFSSSALPVELLYFSANWRNGLATLDWKSGAEENITNYEVEKSLDGESFHKIASVEATGSNSDYRYSTPQAEQVAFYRLRTWQTGAKSDYSKVIKLSSGTSAEGVALYPNPAKDYVNVRIQSPGQLRIYNAAGKQVKSVLLRPGLNRIDISRLSAGVYYGMVAGQKLQFVKK